MTSGATAPALPRNAGFIRGIMLLLPITLAVMGISVLTPVVHLMLEQFKAVPNHDYLVTKLFRPRPHPVIQGVT
jgi:hypothetical protein